MFTGHDVALVEGPVLILGPEIRGRQGDEYDDETTNGPVQCHFQHLQQGLQVSLPGKVFAPDMSVLTDFSPCGHPAVKILHDCAWKWGRQDKLFVLCVLKRKLPGHVSMEDYAKNILEYIGPVNVLRSHKRPCTFETPYKVLNLLMCIKERYGLGSLSHSIEVAGWHSDVTQVRGSWSVHGAHEFETQLIAARGAPAWTEAELESVLEAVGEHFHLQPKRWREGARFVTRPMAKRLRDASGRSFFRLGHH